ncbi:MAG TPA: methylated-DNA--[protein]-cysteine S-methyltransferase [Gemmatimonadaceae bacterium]|nr:methylated-DNA--[protein]-cysteine S-methyltransferase [Gemmatimonadaceae bacterium]
MTAALSARSHRSGRAATARRARADVMHVAFARSPIGLVLVARSAAGLVAVLVGDDREALRRELARRFPLGEWAGSDAVLDALAERVAALVETPAKKLDVPLDMRGTPFQREVWRALRAIPPGATTTYGQLAARLGRPTSARAVGAACGANPLAIVVPCHRVIARDGALTGYRWGVERKRALLEREAGMRGSR